MRLVSKERLVSIENKCYDISSVVFISLASERKHAINSITVYEMLSNHTIWGNGKGDLNCIDNIKYCNNFKQLIEMVGKFIPETEIDFHQQKLIVILDRSINNATFDYEGFRNQRGNVDFLLIDTKCDKLEDMRCIYLPANEPLSAFKIGEMKKRRNLLITLKKTPDGYNISSIKYTNSIPIRDSSKIKLPDIFEIELR